jgi:peptidoglycan/LPS O-acetylase OafA/YrhL
MFTKSERLIVLALVTIAILTIQAVVALAFGMTNQEWTIAFTLTVVLAMIQGIRLAVKKASKENWPLE